MKKAQGSVIEFGRFLETEEPSDCLLCGEHVEPGHPDSGTFGYTQKLAPQLPVHLRCLDGWEMASVLARYERKLQDGGGFAGDPLFFKSRRVH